MIEKIDGIGADLRWQDKGMMREERDAWTGQAWKSRWKLRSWRWPCHHTGRMWLEEGGEWKWNEKERREAVWQGNEGQKTEGVKPGRSGKGRERSWMQSTVALGNGNAWILDWLTDCEWLKEVTVHYKLLIEIENRNKKIVKKQTDRCTWQNARERREKKKKMRIEYPWNVTAKRGDRQVERKKEQR